MWCNFPQDAIGKCFLKCTALSCNKHYYGTLVHALIQICTRRIRWSAVGRHSCIACLKKTLVTLCGCFWWTLSKDSAGWTTLSHNSLASVFLLQVLREIVCTSIAGRLHRRPFHKLSQKVLESSVLQNLQHNLSCTSCMDHTLHVGSCILTRFFFFCQQLVWFAVPLSIRCSCPFWQS